MQPQLRYPPPTINQPTEVSGVLTYLGGACCSQVARPSESALWLGSCVSRSPRSRPFLESALKLDIYLARHGHGHGHGHGHERVEASVSCDSRNQTRRGHVSNRLGWALTR